MATRELHSFDALCAAIAAALPAHGFWDSPVVVGVSGGADSVALLLGLQKIEAAGSSSRLVVAHAEHDLRKTARNDRQFVQDLAERLGLRFVWREMSALQNPDGAGEGIEGRARRLRYSFFEDVARETGARHVVVAHTADDQAETILGRALRGTGVAGLGGMEVARQLCDGVALLRPLLAVSRGSVRAGLAAAGEPWCEDETNADVRYARNFLRREIFPRIQAGPFPAATESLVRLGSQAARTAAALASAAGHLLEAHSQRHADGRIIVRTAALGHLDAHLIAEMFVALWNREGWPRRDMTARHYEELAQIAMARGRGDSPGRWTVDLPAGIRICSVGSDLIELVRR